GRLDEVVVFRQLSKENLKAIVDIELAKVRERLQEKGYKLVLSDEAREFIIEKGGAVEYGARPLRRAVENFIEDPLSENLLQGVFQGSNTIQVNVKEVGDKKQLDFIPTNTDGEAELVGAGAGETAE
ncbi:MAG: NDP-hexose 4-ketoreductase, partial [Planctomycetaceae bacterium]|nr:NDP-hexose 4-ketoreductase [Planctomycetaceae bacterium]